MESIWYRFHCSFFIVCHCFLSWYHFSLFSTTILPRGHHDVIRVWSKVLLLFFRTIPHSIDVIILSLIFYRIDTFLLDFFRKSIQKIHILRYFQYNDIPLNACVKSWYGSMYSFLITPLISFFLDFILFHTVCLSYSFIFSNNIQI